MIITYLLVSAFIVTVTVLTISIYYLTRDSLKTTIKSEIPEAYYVTFTDIIRNTECVTSSQTIKLSAKEKYGKHIRDVEINAQKSDYFYKNQKIKIE